MQCPNAFCVHYMCELISAVRSINTYKYRRQRWGVIDPLLHCTNMHTQPDTVTGLQQLVQRARSVECSRCAAQHAATCTACHYCMAMHADNIALQKRERIGQYVCCPDTAAGQKIICHWNTNLSPQLLQQQHPHP